MGAQGAAGYFSYCMTTIVLVGLAYVNVENYIDDFLVHARTEDEFFENMRQVFLRFRQYNLFAHPDKIFVSD